MPDDLYGAIDLGGTKLRAIAATLDGDIRGEAIVDAGADDGPEAIIARMIETLEAAASQVGAGLAGLRGVGIDTPGALDLVHGIVHEAPQLPGWDGVPLVEIMRDRLGVPVLLENDANANALGEHRFGAGRGTRYMIYLTISTGLGGGIIIEGRIYHGATGAAGELGHVIVQPDGARCLCGENGCLEAYASGTGIVWRAEDLIDAGEARSLQRLQHDKGELRADLIAEAARSGDPAAKGIFDDAGFYLGIALADFVNIFNPEAIVIGGGVVNGAGDLFLALAEATMRKLARKEPLKYVRLERASLGDRSGTLGMIAALADSQPQ